MIKYLPLKQSSEYIYIFSYNESIKNNKLFIIIRIWFLYSVLNILLNVTVQ